MKIYLFHPETGVYLGEDFADDKPMKRGEYVVPADATTIVPPRVENGQILIFNTVEQRWDVRLHQANKGKNALNSISEDNRHGELLA